MWNEWKKTTIPKASGSLRPDGRLWPLALLIAWTACAPQMPAEPMLDEDICSYCRMAVSERQFAAQALSSGRVHFFDDIGCLLRWLANREPGAAREAYVADYSREGWLPAAEAAYVRCETLPTPMGHGLAAFADAGQANEFARRQGGEALTWKQLRKEVD